MKLKINKSEFIRLVEEREKPMFSDDSDVPELKKGYAEADVDATRNLVKAGENKAGTTTKILEKMAALVDKLPEEADKLKISGINRKLKECLNAFKDIVQNNELQENKLLKENWYEGKLKVILDNGVIEPISFG
jgi:hypothetical protein